MQETIQENKVDRDLQFSLGQWNFKDAAKGFDNHIVKSIPAYDFGQNMVLQLATFFFNENNCVYELGCSTGILAEKFLKFHGSKIDRYIGIDNVAEMADLAKKRLIGFGNAEIVHSEASKYDYDPCCLFISYYTLQFIEIAKRKKLIQNMYDSLIDGGAAIIFEKVLSEDSYYQDIINQLYFSFKSDNGFSEEEILNKMFSLQGVLRPLTSKDNIQLLKKAGFKEVYLVFRSLCFDGYLAVK
jgi:tRNA (cmo5U34)-methyltransferase